MEGVYILCHKPVELARLLPPTQGLVCRVGLMGRELWPPDKVSGPVALTSLGATDELGVLHWPSVRASIKTDTLRAVIGYPGLRGESCSTDDEQAFGSGHKVLQQIQGVGIGGAAGGDKRRQP